MIINQDEIIKIAKRDNNKKRTFLLVNPIQGKHIPVSPTRAFSLFEELAAKVFKENNTNNHEIVIGFSETATAIGAAVASYPSFDVNYITTTRESVPDRNYLYFSEEHSHASEQKLDKDFLDLQIADNTRIIFAEDEVTTGKTIENIINVIKRNYPDFRLTFTIASLLNGMPQDKITELEQLNIHCHYLYKVPSYNYEILLNEYHYEESQRITANGKFSADYNTLQLGNYMDVRQGGSMKAYQNICESLSQILTETFKLNDIHQKKILILGTEEFMYPGLYWGQFLEEHTNNTIFFHATTRSPILPCKEDKYPLKTRYQLKSFYEEERVTYIYNLDSYDYVYVLTDAPDENYAMPYLMDALNRNNCQNVTKIIWREETNYAKYLF